MDTENIVWIIVAVVVALALIALAVAAMRKKQAQKAHEHRERAQEIRSQAATHVENVGHAKVGAKEAEARAERARLEAERADKEAAAAKQALAAEKEEYEQRLREADRLDPDVNHKAKDYTPTTPAGTTTMAGAADHTGHDHSTAVPGTEHASSDTVAAQEPTTDNHDTLHEGHDQTGGTHAR